MISGVDPRRGGAEFVNELVLPALTAGRAPHSDGWLTMTHAGSAGVQMRDSTEIDELRYPIVIWSQRLMADTEGAGKYRGAPSAYAEYGPVDTWMQVAYASDGTVNPALGAAGGLPGGLADQSKRLANGDLVEVDACAEVRLEAGERIVSVSAAGGGYGDPIDRPVARVVRDVAEGWVSPERAREVYGVAVSASGELDRNETERLRSAQRS